MQNKNLYQPKHFLYLYFLRTIVQKKLQTKLKKKKTFKTTNQFKKKMVFQAKKPTEIMKKFLVNKQDKRQT